MGCKLSFQGWWLSFSSFLEGSRLLYLKAKKRGLSVFCFCFLMEFQCSWAYILLGTGGEWQVSQPQHEFLHSPQSPLLPVAPTQTSLVAGSCPVFEIPRADTCLCTSPRLCAVPQGCWFTVSLGYSLSVSQFVPLNASSSYYYYYF